MVFMIVKDLCCGATKILPHPGLPGPGRPGRAAARWPPSHTRPAAHICISCHTPRSSLEAGWLKATALASMSKFDLADLVGLDYVCGLGGGGEDGVQEDFAVQGFEGGGA